MLSKKIHAGLTVCIFIFILMLCTSEKASTPTLFASGFKFPEGPTLDKQGNLYLVNLQTNIINKVTPDGLISEAMDVGGVNNGAMFDNHGNLYVACTGRRAILKIDTTGNLSVVTDKSDGDSLLGPNDFAWGNQGRLYFTDPKGSNENNPIGGVHFITADGTTKRFAGGLAFPNGIAFNPDKTILYVGETQRNRILRYTVNPDGSAGKQEIFFELGNGVLPDGMKLDVKGNLWIAVYSKSSLWCVSHQGAKIDSIAIPGENPTNLVFGGPDMRTAYVTEVKTGAVYKVRMPVAGAPLTE